MTEILGFIDESPSAAAVEQTALALAVLLHSSARTVTIPVTGSTTHTGATATALLQILSENDPLLAVLGTRSVESKPEPIGHVAFEVLSTSLVPTVLVPPNSRALPDERPRILLPLDANPETDDALMPLASDLMSAGAELLTLHVFSSQSVPPFIVSGEDLAILAQEFLIRHVPGCSNRCELRIGDPAQHIIETVTTESVDAVLVAWKQDLSPGRAEVIRRLLREAKVPLIVVPIAGS